MSLAVGETHGNDAPDDLPTPEGVEYDWALGGFGRGSTPSGMIRIFVGGSLSVGFTHG